MRLLLLESSPYLPSLGGANKANRLLLEALAARGHECHAIGASGGRSSAETCLAELAACGVTGAAPVSGAPGVVGFRASGVAAETVHDGAHLREHVGRRLRELAPDRVLASSEDPAQLLLQAALAACPGKVVYLAHTTLHLPFGPDGFLDSPAKTELLRKASGIVSVSGFVQGYLRRWAGLDSTVLRFPVYGPGPFPALGRFDQGAVMMINPCAVKGIAIFLELARRLPGLPFVAVPTWGTTEEDRAALAALPNVRLLPPSPDIARVFAEARVLLVPSLWGEAFGQVAVEAMLHGIPVLSSDAGGLPEAKLGVPHVLPVRPIELYRQTFDDRKIPQAEVPEQDVAPWVSALSGLLADRGAYERLAAESKQAAEAFVSGIGPEPFERYLESLAPQAAGTAPRRLRLLLVQPLSYLASPGGAHKANRLLSEGLAANGHDIRVVGPAVEPDAGSPEELRRRLRELGAEVVAETPRSLVFRHRGVQVHAVTDGVELASEATRQVREFAPDWTIVSEDRTFVLLAQVLRESPGRVVCFAHSPATLPFGPASFAPDPRATDLVRRAAGVLTVSRFMRDYVERFGGVPATAVYSPVYGSGPFPNLARFDAGYVTMINPSGIKGIALFAELARRVPEVPFAAVPTWSTRRADRELLASLENVTLLDPVEDIDLLFGSTRALLVPSLWSEAFGQIVVEAMLRGIPVLAADSGALPEAKLGVDYVLPVRPIERYERRIDEKLVPEPVIPEQDAGPWEAALRELLGDRDRYERLSAASHRAAAEFVAGLGIDPYERFFAGLSPAVPDSRPAGAAAEGGLRQKLARLSPERMELLRRRLQREPAAGAAPAAPAPIPRRPRRGNGEDAFPLSFAQERIWFLDRFFPESAVYNEYFAVRLEGRLRPAALAASLDLVARRHEILRTRYVESDGRPLQVIAPPSPLVLPGVDLAALPAPLREAEADRVSVAESRRPFDLAGGAVLRARLLRLGEEEHRLVVAVHHIAADHWAIAVAVRELSAAYGAFAAGEAPALPGLPIQYADFAVWQREWLAAGVLDAQLGYWRGALQGAPALLDLPTDRPRPAIQGAAGASAFLRLPAPVAAAVKALSRQEDATLYMLLLAAFAVFLHRLTGDEDLVVGTPVAGRGRRETEPLLGFFLNTLALRVRPTAGLAFRALLAETRKTALAAFENQDLPFEKLVEELAPARALSHTPIFQVMLNLQNTPHHAFALGDLRLTPLTVELGATKFDLNLYLEEDGEALWGHLVYATDLFDASTMARWLRHCETLLAALPGDPERRLSELPLLTAAELHQVATEWNDTGRPAGAEPRLAHELFRRQAGRTPDATALVFQAEQEERLSYGELAARVDRLAGRLRRRGVGPEVRVGVFLERTPDMVVALLAALTAGGAYVPLDPAHPAERVLETLADAGVRVLVTRPELLVRLPGAEARVAVVSPDAGPREEPAAPASVSPRNLAYVIYTSGSTGRPKGVAVEHRSVAALLSWALSRYAPEELLGTLAATSITFDLSVFELLAPLCSGGRVILARDALALPALPAASEVTLLNTVPSALAELLRLGAVPESVRTVNLAGEPLPAPLAAALYAGTRVARLYNLYGPSEDTTYSTEALVARGDGKEPPIGRPLPGTRAHVLNRDLNPVPLGATGELYLAGFGLARGYLGRPDHTAERFLPCPSGGEPGGRMYRTGDLVRQRATGELGFLGRADHQVKVRGFRIEPGEIEAALLRHPRVREAVVLLEEKGGDRRLVAYVAPAGAESPGRAELREHLLARLPEYMCPALFVPVEALARTPNGKVDRRALAALRLAPEEEPASAAPGNAVEEGLAAIWRELLGLQRIGVEDSFFTLGGHSLLATQVLSRVRQAFGVELLPRALFEAPTLSGLARLVEAALRGPGSAERGPIERVARDGPLPLSFAQNRLWYLDQLHPGSAAFNLPAAVRLLGSLDAAAFAAALGEVVRRHEALRTTFPLEGETPVQRIAAAGLFRLAVADLSGLPAPAREGECLRLAWEETQRPFDLARGPLFRSTLLSLGPGEHALLLTLHHIVGDAWSLGVLVAELSALYAAFTAGRPSPLAELPIQYADFAAWQHRWLASAAAAEDRAYWRARLAGAAFEVPADFPRRPGRAIVPARHPVALPAALGAALVALARRSGGTLFQTLLAGFSAVLGFHARSEEVVVGSNVANRNRLESEGLIGFFVNLLVLRVDLAGDPTFLELLARVRALSLDAFAHQDLPFDQLVQELGAGRDPDRTPLFQVKLDLLPRIALDRFGDLELRPLDAGKITARYDLHLELAETAQGIGGALLYDAGLFAAPTAARLVRSFEKLLEIVAAGPELRLAEVRRLLAAAERELRGERRQARKESSLGNLQQVRRRAVTAAATPTLNEKEHAS